MREFVLNSDLERDFYHYLKNEAACHEAACRRYIFQLRRVLPLEVLVGNDKDAVEAACTADALVNPDENIRWISGGLRRFDDYIKYRNKPIRDNIDRLLAEIKKNLAAREE